MNKSLRQKLSIALLSGILTFVLALKAQAEETLNVLEIRYMHFTLGYVRVLSNKNCFRISCADHHFDVIAKAPKWQVFSYNRDHHLFNEISTDSFISFIAQMNEGWMLKFPADTVSTKTTYVGMPAIRKDVLIMGRNLGWTKDYDSKRKVSLEAMIYDGDMVSVASARILNEMFDVRSSDRLLLELKLLDRDQKGDTRLRCQSGVRKDVPKQLFDVPTGFKKGTLAQVFGNAELNSPGVRGLIDDMGLGRSF